MPARVLFLGLSLFLCLPARSDVELAPPDFRADFEQFWQIVAEDYAYWDVKATDWPAVKQAYGPRFA